MQQQEDLQSKRSDAQFREAALPLALENINVDATKPLKIDRVNVGGRTLERRSIHTEPSVDLVPQLVLPEEAAKIIEVLSNSFERSKVGYDDTNASVSNARTSSTCFLRRAESKIVADIEERISAISGYPVSHIEPMQVLRYEPGQLFDVHHDYLLGNDMYFEESGDRRITCLMYLNSLTGESMGGRTKFPELGIAVPPTEGLGLMWENLTEDGKPYENSLHCGEAPKEGTKYVMVAWIREREYPA